MAEEILLKDTAQKKFDLEELYQLQEAVFYCKDYDEIIRIVETFPEAKSPSARTPARHLINILWGFHMELEALTALKDKGYKAEFVEDDRHRFLHDGYDDYNACDIRITEGDRKGDYDVAGWTSYPQYANPSLYVKRKPTIDVVLRPGKDIATLYFTGRRTRANCAEKAMLAEHFDFYPIARDEDISAWTYKDRMLAEAARLWL